MSCQSLNSKAAGKVDALRRLKVALAVAAGGEGYSDDAVINPDVRAKASVVFCLSFFVFSPAGRCKTE